MPHDFRTRYLQEIDRIGLDDETCPYGGMASGSEEAVEAFLAHLRSLRPGATWRDVYPDIPAHWDLDDPESWTVPYRPLFAWDYQTLPTGPMCMLHVGLDAPDHVLDQLLRDAQASGFVVHGAGFVPISNPEWPDRPIRLVLHHTTTEAQLFAFAAFIGAHPAVHFDGVCRNVDEVWAPDSPR